MTDFANDVIEWGNPPVQKTLLQLMKDIMGVTDNAQDAEFSMYLDMAGNAAEHYIDNILEQREVTERIAKKYVPVALRFYPATNVTSVMIDGLESVADFTRGSDDGIEWVIEGVDNYMQSHSFKQMDITYTAGYNPLPSDVGFAIVRGAVSYSQGSSAGAGAVKKQVVEGVGSIEYATSEDQSAVGMLPASSTMVLDKFRRLYV